MGRRRRYEGYVKAHSASHGKTRGDRPGILGIKTELIHPKIGQGSPGLFGPYHRSIEGLGQAMLEGIQAAECPIGHLLEIVQTTNPRKVDEFIVGSHGDLVAPGAPGQVVGDFEDTLDLIRTDTARLAAGDQGAFVRKHHEPRKQGVRLATVLLVQSADGELVAVSPSPSSVPGEACGVGGGYLRDAARSEPVATIRHVRGVALRRGMDVVM